MLVYSQHVAAECWLVRTSELGSTAGEQRQLFARTHLGHLLRPGDSVLGCASASACAAYRTHSRRLAPTVNSEQ